MSASITLSGVTWSTPEGRTLLSNLDLSVGTGRTGLVGRNGVGKTTLLKLVTGDLSPQAGSVTVNGTVGVLRQSVQVGWDEAIADLFGAKEGLRLLRRAEEGVASVEEIGHADWTLEARITAALGRLGLEASPETSLASLSGGQRTRVALAALVFADPDFCKCVFIGDEQALRTYRETSMSPSPPPPATELPIREMDAALGQTPLFGPPS